MSKMITRTFKLFTVIITDAKTGEIIREEVFHKKVSKEKVAMKFLKETGNIGVLIDIVESEECREMSFETFISNSKLMTADNKEDNTTLAENENNIKTEKEII